MLVGHAAIGCKIKTKHKSIIKHKQRESIGGPSLPNVFSCTGRAGKQVEIENKQKQRFTEGESTQTHTEGANDTFFFNSPFNNYVLYAASNS